MKTPTNRTAHRLAAVLAIATAFATTGAWAADWTVSENTALTEDKTVDALTVDSGVTLDLNGCSLTCTSLAGSGTITSTGSTDLTSPEAAGATPSAVTWEYAGNIASGSVTNLFDNDFTTYSDPHRLRTDTTLNNQHFTICYDFGEDTPRVVNKYKIHNGFGNLSRSPYIWDVEGSNDNSSWTPLHTVEESKVADIWSKIKETKEFSFDNTDAYRYYKIVFKKTGANAFEIKQLEYFNTNPGELHVNAPDGGAVNSTVTISGNVKVVSEGTGSFTVGADINVDEFVFSDGASATLTVAEGKTLTTKDISGIGKILNYGTIVKTGTGAVSWPFDNASTGLYVVSAGTVRVNNHTGTGNAGSSQIIRVKNGASFDIHGTKAFNFSVVLEEGSRFVNSSSDIGNNNSQAMSLSLEGDATVTHYRTFGLRGPEHGETTLNLGTYTLTLNSTGTPHDFILDNTTISGTGTIFVKNGTLYATQRDSVGLDCTVSIGSEGGLNLGKNLTVKDFVNNGTISGSATLTVLGELTPGNVVTNLTLASGATVKATGTAQTVSTTFSASGTVYIDATDIVSAIGEGDVPVLTVPKESATSAANWSVINAGSTNAVAKWRTDEGDTTKTLYVCKPTGLMVIFK